MRTRTVRTLIYLAAGLGLIVSIFAALEFYEASLRSLCSINAFFSCSTVDTSGRTTTLWIPDYLWGIGGFLLTLAFAVVAESRPRHRRWTYALLGLTSLGVGLSLYFVYVELALIGAFCVVCATAYVFGGIAWGGALALATRPPRGSEPTVHRRRPRPSAPAEDEPVALEED